MERSSITRNLIVTALVAVLMACFVLLYTLLAPAQAQMGSDAAEMGMAGGPVVPPAKGYAEGEEILFIHTEASDLEIARWTDLAATRFHGQRGRGQVAGGGEARRHRGENA